MIIKAITKGRGVLLLLLSIMLVLVSCADRRELESVYTESCFSAEICWILDGSEYTAHLVAEAPRTDGVGRDIKLEFIAPEELCGLVAERKNGKVELKRGDMTVEIHNQAILKAAELVCAEGKLSYKAKSEADGRQIIIAARLCGNESAEIWLDAESRAPVRIMYGKYDISVVWFEFSDREATK